MTPLPLQLKDTTGRLGRAAAVCAVVLAAGGAAAWLASGKPPSTAPAASVSKESDGAPKIRRTAADEVAVPAEVRASLGLKTAPAAAPARRRALPAFQGTLNFDSSQLARVQSPFAGSVIELAQMPDAVYTAMPGAAPPKTFRPLRAGDRVERGAVLAVVWSKELGEKKREFVDAISKLKSDVVTLMRLDDLYV
jgi:cobalt-zinc-cadmium efflux system membrane fusion protein